MSVQRVHAFHTLKGTCHFLLPRTRTFVLGSSRIRRFSDSSSMPSKITPPLCGMLATAVIQRRGTSISQVYNAMSSVSFAPIPVFPEYLKGGGGHHSGDDDYSDGSCPSGDITLIVSIVEEYADDDSESGYEQFMEDLFSAMYNVGGGSCMDDHDTDPHVSMSRGVKFKSSYHQEQYMYAANLEVAVWQAMYPNGVVIGSSGSAAFPPGTSGASREYVGYGNLYFFFDRANITKAFRPDRDLTDTEYYYSTLYSSGGATSYYSSVTSISFDYSGSGGDNQQSYEHNAYTWKSSMAIHDFTDGWDLPPDCNMEGETFLGIPLSRKSESKLQSTGEFQESFNFDYVVDRNWTYIQSFGTNHGWLCGETVGNGAGSIVDKDTAHLPIFYLGTTDPNMGGLSLSNMIKLIKKIEFGTLYIKPAFVFQDENGHIKLQFEADPKSAMGYLYDNLCKYLGIKWNYQSPYNKWGLYTNCAMHAAGDRAKYGCGPEGANSGGFCPQVTLGYKVRFQSEDHATAFLYKANTYVDYWRSLYPSGVAVGTSSFCPDTGCLGLFLNRYDLYYVFGPELSGSWVEFNGASLAPTISPAPTWKGGCDDPHNHHLDICFKKMHAKPKFTAVVWDSLGKVGQFSVFLVLVMGATLMGSVFIARARKRRRKGEGYVAFLWRDLTRKKRKKRLRPKTFGAKDLQEPILETGSGIRRSRSKSRSRSRSRGAGTGLLSESSSIAKHRSRSITESPEGGAKAIRPTTLQPGSGTDSSKADEQIVRSASSTSRGSRRSRSSRQSRESKNKDQDHDEGGLGAMEATPEAEDDPKYFLA